MLAQTLPRSVNPETVEEVVIEEERDGMLLRRCSGVKVRVLESCDEV